MQPEQEELSPSHSPQSSNEASPPHSPAQSISTKQLPSQSKFSSAYSQSPSFPKLHASGSLQVSTSS